MEEYITRQIDISQIIQRRSLFLIGPRLTGKSTYIRNQAALDFALTWNLLNGKLRFRAEANPGLLREEVEAKNLSDCLIFIDEIQKCPALLDDIHLLIEERNIRFLLTGSSLYKLRRGGVNLLGGRASRRYLHPFIFREAVSRKGGEPLALERIFHSGMLPAIFLSEDAAEDLSAFIHTYLIEEIAAEGAVRNLTAFSRFLQTAALVNTQILNYQNVAHDAQLPPQTVKNWFQILYDTLLAFELPAFTGTVKRKSFTTSKFYLFDVGVARSLRGIDVPKPASKDFGDLFEHFIAMELKAWVDYTGGEQQLRYWRSKSGFEVDFVIGRTAAIEVKSAEAISRKHMKGLVALSEEGIFKQYVLVCREDRPRKVGEIEILPWRYFLDRLWTGTLVFP